MSIGITGYGCYVPRLRIKAEEIARIYQNGSVEVANKLFDLTYPNINETPHFKLDLFKNNEQFAELYFVQKTWPSVEIFEAEKGLSILNQGTYITPIENSINFSKSFVSNSTHSSSGYLVTDPAQKSEGPGFSYESLEDASKNEGVGFRGENKHMLLFAGGNTVGESNLSHASEIGVNLGDPTIHLEPNKDSDFIGLEDPDIWMDEDTGLMHVAAAMNVKTEY